MGLRWEDESVQVYGKSHPYRITECDGSVSNHSSIAFQIPLLNEETVPTQKLVSPEMIGAEVLKYLLKITSRYLGHNQVGHASLSL
jgi:hypothetical protein